MTPDNAIIRPTTDHFACAFAVSTLFGSPKESIYCRPAMTNEITVTIPSTVNIQLKKVARTQRTGPEKQMAGKEKTLPKEVEALPVERPTPVGTQVPPSILVPAGQETGPLPEPDPLPTPVNGAPLKPEPLPTEPEPLPEPEPERYPTEHSTAQTIRDTLPSAAQDILLKAIPAQPALLTSYVARSS